MFLARLIFRRLRKVTIRPDVWPEGNADSHFLQLIAAEVSLFGDLVLVVF